VLIPLIPPHRACDKQRHLRCRNLPTPLRLTMTSHGLVKRETGAVWSCQAAAHARTSSLPPLRSLRASQAACLTSEPAAGRHEGAKPMQSSREPGAGRPAARAWLGMRTLPYPALPGHAVRARWRRARAWMASGSCLVTPLAISRSSRSGRLACSRASVPDSAPTGLWFLPLYCVGSDTCARGARLGGALGVGRKARTGAWLTPPRRARRARQPCRASGKGVWKWELPRPLLV